MHVLAQPALGLILDSRDTSALWFSVCKVEWPWQG